MRTTNLMLNNVKLVFGAALILAGGCLMGCASLASVKLSPKPFIHVKALGAELTVYGYEWTDKRTLGESAEVE